MAASKASTLLSRCLKKAIKPFASKPSAAKPYSAESSAADTTLASVDDMTLKMYISSLDDPSVNGPTASEGALGEGRKLFCDQISSILCDEPLASSPHLESIDNENSMMTTLEIPWFPTTSHNLLVSKRKEACRDKKHKFVFKSGQSNRFKKLITNCAQRLGTDAMFEVFGRMGRDTGVKEFNAMIAVQIENARKSNDIEVVLDEIEKAFELFKIMRKRGFAIEEETYGPLINYFIDMEMAEEFQVFLDVVREANPSSAARLGYYEMLFWIAVNDEVKIQELCSTINDGNDALSSLQENYMVALCERDRKEDLQRLLEIVDITKFSSVDNLSVIFQFLGRFSLESLAEKLLLELKNSDYGLEDLSNLIFSYTTSIPNLAVEDVILKFKRLLEELEVLPTSASYEKLVKHSCDSLEVHVALDLVKEMSKAGLTISIDILDSLLHASKQSCEFNLVQTIYSIICDNNVKPNSDTFRSMITLSVRMKDFEGAYRMLSDMEKLNLTPTTSIYNAIMAGYFREKNTKGALMVLKQMEDADVKPDSITFSYLINNCEREEDIVKCCEELKKSGNKGIKQIFMSLVNAYASCGQFEKAKQVVLDPGIPATSLNEIKSVLVSALASNGQMSDALGVYEEMKQAGCTIEPKAIIALIEYFEPETELSTLLGLLEELHDPVYWMDGCYRAILFCVRNKHSSFVFDLLRKLEDHFYEDDIAMEYLFDEVFSLIAHTEPTDLELGLDLLRFIKEELGFSPSRKCLDLLLSACVSAKDKQSSLLIWKEYQAAGLPYNVLTFLRMYQALLASGDSKAAKVLLRKIPTDDTDVCCIIHKCQSIYCGAKPKNRGKEEKIEGFTVKK